MKLPYAIPCGKDAEVEVSHVFAAVAAKMKLAVIRAQKTSDDRAIGLLDWGRRFAPHYLTLTPGTHQAWLSERLTRLREERGKKLVVVSPRDSAKSTYISFLLPLRSACEGTETYIMILAETYALAVKHLQGIKHELVANEELEKAYPEACGRGTIWNDVSIVTRNGVRIEAMGTGQNIRGRRERENRPSLVIVDDPSGENAAYSSVVREHEWDWISKGVLKAGSPFTNYVVSGTMIHNDCVVGKCCGTGGWETKKFRAVVQWPKNMDLWQEWELLYNDLGNEHRELRADAFYAEHEAALTLDAEVLWPAREGLLALMQMRAGGHAAFESEKQNDPIDPSKCEWGPYLFPDSSDGMDQRWFAGRPMRIGERADLCVVAMDPSKSGKDRTSDYCSIVTLQREGGFVYVEADLTRRDTGGCMDAFFKECQKVQPDVCGMETQIFQDLFIQEVVQKYVGQDLVPPVPIVNRVNKQVRIRRLDAWLRSGVIRWKRTPGTIMLLKQLAEFPNGDHDDGPDALEMAFRLLGHALGFNEHPQQTMQPAVAAEMVEMP